MRNHKGRCTVLLRQSLFSYEVRACGGGGKEMLIMQRRQGSNKQQEKNELIVNYMAANELLCGWWVECNGPTKPENGKQHRGVEK